MGKGHERALELVKEIRDGESGGAWDKVEGHFREFDQLYQKGGKDQRSIGELRKSVEPTRKRMEQERGKQDRPQD